MICSLDRTAMGIDNSFTDRKPDSHSFVAVAGFICVYATAIKKGWEPLRINTFSVVFNTNIKYFIFCTYF